jgi:DNA-binding response OmpR family regulator
MRVLLVEDDPVLGDGIQKGLKNRGYTIDWVQDGISATTALETESFEALILDLNLPGCSGLEVLKKLRGRKSAIPVLILTARDSVTDRVQGLDSGADDYLIKPLDLDELAARLRAITRRAQGHIENKLLWGDVVLDPAAHQVTLKGQPVELSPKEFTLLFALLDSAGRVLSKEQLESRLYGWNEEVESNSVEVHVHHLRKKLGADMIRTIRGVGYLIPK